ncbi:MAG: 4-hydroxyphenylpyruvate dioxygenase [Alphaproteobacteria bacterium]|nr:4-hydroxyphenylpyruvate dioxygenase [Alphaproteobacteria bacterium]
MADLHENPLKTNGFEFVEYAGDVDLLHKTFTDMGFAPIAKHKERDVTLYRQGRVNFLLNAEKDGQGAEFSKEHGTGASAMAFVVEDAAYAYAEGLKRGATAAGTQGRSMNEHIPAIEGIGGTLLYLVDDPLFYEQDFEFTGDEKYPAGLGMTYIDHLTHNVFRGNMDKWAKFYEDIFNFKEIRYFDIEGKLTGLKSRAMTSPCGKIRIPLNESSDDKSQIEEFLKRYNGEGIQHIALGTDDIYATVEGLRANKVVLQDTPDTYYEGVEARVPGHGEDLEKLKELRILIDGAPTDEQGLLLQIFTQDAMGPVFFEIIQRKGNEGFGEGNFQALFESIELDQVRRGVLDDDQKEAS